VPGRDFELRLGLTPDTLRVEVSDTRGERRPPQPGTLSAPPPVAETGRGLLLAEALADRWAVIDRVPVGKTVRAELDLGDGARRARLLSWPAAGRVGRASRRP
jgi:hypothetical protein